MAAKYSEQDIEKLMRERKALPKDYRQHTRIREKRGHKGYDMDIEGENGNHFRIILRQSSSNPLDFSVILAARSPSTNQLFRLRRYNGKHQHTNKIERTVLYGFHIHQATERYQDYGSKEDAYAEVTQRYGDLSGALDCLIKDCAFVLPSDPQMNLFDEV